MTGCPSGLQIARWEAGRGAATDDEGSRHLAAHVHSCPRCSTRVAEIADARSELFPGDAARESARVAHALLVSDAVRRARQADRSPWQWQWQWIIRWAGAPVLAGATALLLLAPRLQSRATAPISAPVAIGAPAATIAEPAATGVAPAAIGGSAAISAPAAVSGATASGASVASGPMGVRAKGHLVVQAFCKRNDAVFPVEDGGEFLSGDRLRFAYSAPSAGNLMIFSVDDRGEISPYYSDETLRSVPVAAGAKAMLPGSVELDDHHGLERVFALWAAQPLDGAQVRRAVTNALASSGSIARVAKLGLAADQVSYLLRRP